MVYWYLARQADGTTLTTWSRVDLAIDASS